MWNAARLNPHGFACDTNTQMNLETLAFKLNKFEALYGKPLTLTNALRDMQDHLRIYAEKNAKLRARGLPEVKVPLSSKHLFGQAADMADPKGELRDFIRTNKKAIQAIGFWFEKFESTIGWCHFQIVAPGSGAFEFIP